MANRSEFLKLKQSDFWKGLIVAGFSSAVSTIGAAASMIVDFSAFEWSTLLKAFGIGAVIGFSGYISKNLFSNSEGKPFKKENNE